MRTPEAITIGISVRISNRISGGVITSRFEAFEKKLKTSRRSSGMLISVSRRCIISARSIQRPPGLISYQRAPRQLRTLSHRGLYTVQLEHRILPLVFGGTVRSLQPFACGILEDDGPADQGGTAPRARVDGCCHQGWGHHSYEERTSRLRLRILSSGRTQTSAEVRSRPDKTILILPCHSQKQSCSLRASKPLSTGPWQAGPVCMPQLAGWLNIPSMPMIFIFPSTFVHLTLLGSAAGRRPVTN